jgi:hypothetical protein
MPGEWPNGKRGTREILGRIMPSLAFSHLPLSLLPSLSLSKHTMARDWVLEGWSAGKVREKESGEVLGFLAQSTHT